MTLANTLLRTGDAVDAPVFPHPVALCDIGGTNVRLAEVAAPGAPVRAVARFPTEGHDDLAAAVHSQRNAFSRPPASLIVCAAGPLDGRRVSLTNARWTIDGPQVATTLGLRQGLLLNDFEAQAIMLPALRPDAVRAIGNPSATVEHGARLILGPGTGLGAALLVPWQGRLMPLVTEAGHMGFAASNAFERDVWAVVQRRTLRITGETLLSGPGTVRLYHAVCELGGVPPATNDPAAITDMAEKARDGMEATTLRLFWTLAARFSGNLALGFLAKGGVVLSGGILRKIADFLDPAEFRRAFADQAPLEAIVARIPVALATDEGSVLDGLAALAAQPERFMIDWHGRLWM